MTQPRVQCGGGAMRGVIGQGVLAPVARELQPGSGFGAPAPRELQPHPIPAPAAGKFQPLRLHPQTRSQAAAELQAWLWSQVAVQLWPRLRSSGPGYRAKQLQTSGHATPVPAEVGPEAAREPGGAGAAAGPGWCSSTVPAVP